MGDDADYYAEQEMMEDEPEYFRQERITPKAKQLKEIADKIIKTLKAEGFIIQRYNAYSTNSIYLKLDYGMCNSIRISDHKGKEGLDYRYNVMTNIKEYRVDISERGFPKFFYTPKMIDSMINQIVEAKRGKVNVNGGAMGYQIMMKATKLRHQGEAGFWKESVLV